MAALAIVAFSGLCALSIVAIVGAVVWGVRKAQEVAKEE